MQTCTHSHTHKYHERTEKKEKEKENVSFYCDCSESIEKFGDLIVQNDLFVSKLIYHHYNHNQGTYNIDFPNVKTWTISLGISIHFILQKNLIK